MAQGIPMLPDLTQPQQILQFGSQLLGFFLVLAILVLGLGIVLALLNFSLRADPESTSLNRQWTEYYRQILSALPHGLLVISLILIGFLMFSTLANRYHNWEQARISKISATLEGDRLEQTAPLIRYIIQETYTAGKLVDGNYIEEQKTRNVDRYLTLANTNVQVKLDRIVNPQTFKTAYNSNFAAEYKVVNTLSDSQTFYFESPPPSGYSLLQNFRVERDGKRLTQINSGDYGFPFELNPSQESKFKVTYQSSGGAKWIYSTNGKSLSGFRLDATTTFPDAEFASGIIPTEIEAEANGKRFSWIFEDNVTVQNPFGVFSTIGAIRNVGILPRLLFLAPALFLWWLLLLYFSVPMSLLQVAIAGGCFFASLLALTYASRLVDASLAWSIFSLVSLAAIWRYGGDRRITLSVIICTIAGMILPVLGLLVPYSGILLSLAGLMSMAWLLLKNRDSLSDRQTWL
jgi:hypothetical protein